MLPALRQNRSRQRTSKTTTVSAPIKGWNLKARSTEAGIEYASVMENFIPDIGQVTLRSGSVSHVTGIAASVDTLMEYAYGASSELFAAKSTDIYDVTASGAVGAAKVSSLTNGRWEYVNFSTTGGNFLLLVNGADGVRSYNGTTWATETITGVTAANIDHIFIYQERVWFIEKNTLSAWYLPVLAKSGAVTELDLGSIFNRGGRLIAGETWSRDGGAGMDDVAVWITSEGEVAIFQGNNPASAATWALVGVFQIDRPIGRRCLVNVGADLVVLTESGIYPMSQVLIAGSPQQVIPDEIRDAFQSASADSKSTFGWQLVNYRSKGWVLVNIPFSSGSRQYVLNLVTSRWFEITGWDAQCFGSLSGALYFAESGGGVIKADTGLNDQNTAIVARFITGWDDFGNDNQKQFKMVRPLQSANNDFTPLVEMLVDYDRDGSANTAPAFTGEEGAVWDEELWDVAEWISVNETRNRWRGVTGVGTVGAILYEARVQNVTLSISGFDVVWERGGIL